MAITRDGRYIISGSMDETVAVWDASSGRKIRSLEEHNSAPKSIAISHSGEFVVSGAENSQLIVWNFRNADLLETLKGNAAWITGARFVKSANQVLFASEEKDLKLWDFSRGKPIRTFQGHRFWVNSLEVTKDGKWAISGSDDGQTIIWEIATGKPKHIFQGSRGFVQKTAFSPDGKLALAVYSDNLLNVWSLDKNQLIRTYQGKAGKVVDADFLPDNNRILICEQFGVERVWEIASGKTVRLPNVGQNDIQATAVSPNGKTLLLGVYKTIYLYDLSQNRITGTFNRHTDDIEAFGFANDGQQFVSASKDHTVKLWRLDSAQALVTFHGHSGAVKSVAFSPDNQMILSGANDGSLNLWRKDGELLLTAISKGKDWILFTPDGYFDSNKDAGELVHMVKGISVFGVDQFAIRNNRPDIILNRLHSSESGLIDYFHALYQRRLKKAGIKENQLNRDYHVPRVTISQTEQAGRFATIDFEIVDTKYPLTSYNIYINDVQLFGDSGRHIEGKQYHGSETVRLGAGQNKIEISALNSAGAESYRALLHLHHKTKTVGDLYYIGFGMADYRDKRLNLSYADKDAEDLQAVFTRMKGKQFNQVYAYTFTNHKATLNQIRISKQLLSKARVDDTVVLFIAGHGLYEKTGQATYYYLTYDTDLSNLSETAADFELLEDILDRIAPRKKLFLIDTCESGELDKNSKTTLMLAARNQQMTARTYRGVKLVTRTDDPCLSVENQRGINLVDKSGNLADCAPRKNRFFLYDRSRYIHNDLFRRSGAIVFTSSLGGELSYESDTVQNGFFSDKIIKALSSSVADQNHDGEISIDELCGYVGKTVPQQTRNAQHPAVERDNIY